MRTVKATLVVAAVVVACACGGASKRGDPGPTSAVAGGGLVVEPSELTFVHVLGNTSPGPRSVYASWTADDVAALTADFVDGAAIPSWLAFSVAKGSASGHAGSFDVRVDPSRAPAGTQSTTLQVGITRADGTVIESTKLTVTLVVKTAGASEASVDSTAVFGSSATPFSSTVWVGSGSAATWTASADAPWVKLDPAAGRSGQMTVRYDATGLGVGTYQGTITFSAGTGAVDRIPVTLTVRAPTLTIFPSPLPLAGLGGYDPSPKKVEVSLDTGRNAYPYTVASDTDFVGVVPGIASASATPGVFTATPTASAQAAWTAGTTASGKLTVTADVNGVPVTGTVDVSYVPDDLKLLVSETGIALTKTPGLERLSRVVEVRTNRGLPSTWMAISSQPWLDVTRSGSTDAPLVLSVPDASGLGVGLHEAAVTVSSTDPRLILDSATIRVGLWIDDVTPDPLTIVTVASRYVAADPVRPYVYLTDVKANVRVFNVYTGEAVGEFVVPGAPELASVTVSDDGQRLWVLDGKLPVRRIVPIDLAAHAVGTPWPLPGAINSSELAFARTNGVPLLLASTGVVYDAETAATVATFKTPGSWSALAASRDGSRFCLLEQGTSAPLLICHDLATTTRGTSRVLVGPTKAGSGTSGPDIALSPDGARLFVAQSGSAKISAWDPSLPTRVVSDGTVGPMTAPKAIDIGPDGRIFCGTDGSYGGSDTARVYDARGTLLASYALGYVMNGFIAVSGDGLRLVAGIGGYPAPSLQDTGHVKFVTIPAP